MDCRRFLLSILLTALLAVDGLCADPTAVPLKDRLQFRRPVAAAWLELGKSLLTANRRSGTISIVNVERGVVVDEFAVGERLADLASLPDPRHYAVADDKTHELIVFRIEDDGRLQITGRTAVARYPAGIAVSADGATALVTGMWSHAVDLVALQPKGPKNDPALWNAAFPRVVDTIALPFAPREIAFYFDEPFAIVLDAFGGRMALLDLSQRTIQTGGDLGGHNFHGLTVDVERREVCFVGQYLESQATTDRAYIRYGKLMSNRLWRLSGTPERHGPVTLDRFDAGAADPSATAITSGERTLVCLGGLQKLAVVADDKITQTFDVGARPVAVLPTPDGGGACVVNQLDDSISVVDLESGATRNISLGPQPELYPRDRGEHLFFDARLSAGGFMSCHSCHPDGHSNGRTADTLADGSYGTPKRVLTLMGTALTDHWSWNGSLRELRDQVRQSFETTMRAAPLKAEQHDDVVAFLHTLPFPPPPDPTSRDDADCQLLEQGRELFKSFGCASCHVAPLTYTTQGSFDVGLRDEQGLAKFNPPSLRGVGQNSAFFHDNRAATLEDVFRSYGHQLPDEASDADIEALVRFLRSL